MKNVRWGCQTSLLGLMWEKKKAGLYLFHLLCVLRPLHSVSSFFLSRKIVPVKLMFWQGFSSQSKSNPFFLVPFHCILQSSLCLFWHHRVLTGNSCYLLIPLFLSPNLKLHCILGGFTLPSVYRAMVWSLLHSPPSLFCAQKNRGGRHIFQSSLFY